jgi:hypothetical protein
VVKKPVKTTISANNGSPSLKSDTPRIARKSSTPASAKRTLESVSAATKTGTTTKPQQNVAKASTAATDSSANGGGMKKYQDMTEEEREKEIQRLLQVSELMPTVDPFGQQILETLGLFWVFLFFRFLILSFIQGRRYDSLSR